MLYSCIIGIEFLGHVHDTVKVWWKIFAGLCANYFWSQRQKTDWNQCTGGRVIGIWVQASFYGMSV